MGEDTGGGDEIELFTLPPSTDAQGRLNPLPSREGKFYDILQLTAVLFNSL
jgi:hypothetical protein